MNKPGRPARADGKNARTEANKNYNNKAYERINLVVKKGNRERIREAATAAGLSVNGYINNLLYESIPGFVPMDGSGSA